MVSLSRSSLLDEYSRDHAWRDQAYRRQAIDC